MTVMKNFQEKPSEIMTWGNDVHKALEERVRDGKPLPVGMRQWEPIAAALSKQPGDKLIEQKLALNENFNPTTWFAKNVWVRSVVDLALLHESKAVIVDYKTGKVKEDFDQLALMAAVMFNQAEELEQITAMFIWLQEEWPGNISKVTYTRDELPQLWERFLKREEAYQDAHRNTEFPPKPSGLCRNWCPVRTCEYHGG
jgi:hypothetical protein